MPSRLEKLLQAKYKQVPFLVRREEVTQLGQKRITHDYPNTQARYMEPQGKVPPEFSLTLFFSSENWQREYLEFKKAIEDPTPGRLTLPNFGTTENVVANPARAEAVHTDIGEISVTVTFSVTVERPAPTQTSATEQDVSDQAQVARGEAKAAVAGNYKTPSSLNNAQTADYDLKTLVKDVQTITGLAKEAQEVSRKIATALKDPEKLGNLLLNSGSPEGFLQKIGLKVEDFTQFKKIATLGNNLPAASNDVRAAIEPRPSTVTAQVYNPDIPSQINTWS